jgi:dTDP-4-amino-4,6-dideoxygalactose transaminase
MNQSKIYLSSPHLGEKERDYVKEAFDTNWVAPLGPNVNGFESDLQTYNNIAYCAALSSGTGAIHLALILAGVVKGDEVLCSTFTFSASANPIVYQGATPIFIDSEKDTWNMCPIQLKRAIADRIEKGKKPKACIVVNLYGMPAKLEEIKTICNQYEITLIEDAAESLGATYKGKKTGTFGDFGIYSFNGNKIITTSGGGALVSEDKKLIEKARFLATQARDPAPHYQHSHIGYNYRMSNICAGIGRGQMEVLDERIAQRRAINNWYRELLKGIDFVEFQTESNKDYFSNYWLTAIMVKDNAIGITRETLRLALQKENIESRPLWKPMHLQPVFCKYPSYLNGVSEQLFEKGLCLPSGSNLIDKEIERIETVLKKQFELVGTSV